ncbi:MAG: HAD hydrolase-like protein [Planctomycetes bacterium]|nr:HAD hydrolase-like protein [Planctomycetota bacterium]
MALTLEQYAKHLDTRDLPWPAPPEVTPAKAKPHLVPLPDIRAVTWSVYGTLLALTGGELYFDHPQKFIMDVALDKTIQEFNMWGSMSRKPGQPADYMKQIYTKLLEEQTTLSTSGKKHPEVAADRIWEAILKRLLQKDYKFDAGFYGALNEYSAKIAYFFHASLQGTACEAGAAGALRHVADRGLVQGLIANAQVFTLVQLQRGLTQQDPKAKVDQLIDPKVRGLSYQVGVRKPNEEVFQHALEALQERDIGPQEVLHIGSRITQDVAPAKKLGMRTALFAGDTASLEATAEQLKNPATRPDLLLTRLDQITQVLP